MHYFALLISPERDLTPDEGAAEMTAYQDFHAKAASAIRAGDALQSQSSGVRITGGPDAPVVTDGPFAEGAEVAVATTYSRPRTSTRRWRWPATFRRRSTAGSRSGRWSSSRLRVPR